MSTSYAVSDKELRLIKQDRNNMLCLFDELEDAEKYHKGLVEVDKLKSEVVKIDLIIKSKQRKG